MRLTIRHVTSYRFENPVAYGLQQLRKTPKSTWGQTVTDWQTDISGGAREVSFEDNHNNVVELISFEREATQVTVTSSGVVEIDDTAGIMGKHKGPSPLWLYLRSTPLTHAGQGVRAEGRAARFIGLVLNGRGLERAVAMAEDHPGGLGDEGGEQPTVRGVGKRSGHPAGGAR